MVRDREVKERCSIGIGVRVEVGVVGSGAKMSIPSRRLDSMRNVAGPLLSEERVGWMR